MYIHLLYGPYAGELQFIVPHVARQLIAQGRALDPRLLAEPPTVGLSFDPEQSSTTSRSRKGRSGE